MSTRDAGLDIRGYRIHGRSGTIFLASAPGDVTHCSLLVIAAKHSFGEPRRYFRWIRAALTTGYEEVARRT